eukprot:777378_1
MAASLVLLHTIISSVHGRFDFKGIYTEKSLHASQPQLFDQTLDHFNIYAYNAGTTFKQRWCYNDQYWSGVENQGPLLYIVGGEGPNGCGFYGFVEEFAQQVGGLLLTSEHRFYGESMPFGTTHIDHNYILDTDHLGLLQVEQAMADYMTLMHYWQTQYFNCTICPVIVFGVSYPGELAVWLRLKYPQYFDMALASSGPIFYTSSSLVDPYCYYGVITNATKHTTGSSACSELVQRYTDSLLNSTPQQITSAIPLCDPLSADKQKGLYELEAFLYETWANYGMGNYPPSTSGMRTACDRMMDNGDQSNGLNILSNFLEPYKVKKGCLDLTSKRPAGPNAAIHCADLTGCGTGYSGESWDYQACSQNIEPFATNNVTDMFDPNWIWNMAWLDEHCMNRFKIKATTRDQWMTKQFGLDPMYFDTKLKDMTSHIIFSNGMQDGWHCGGVVQNMSDTLIAITIESGAHGSDMRPESDQDTDDMKQARAMERRILKQWLSDMSTKLKNNGRDI